MWLKCVPFPLFNRSKKYNTYFVLSHLLQYLCLQFDYYLHLNTIKQKPTCVHVCMCVSAHQLERYIRSDVYGIMS